MKKVMRATNMCSNFGGFRYSPRAFQFAADEKLSTTSNDILSNAILSYDMSLSKDMSFKWRRY